MATRALHIPPKLSLRTSLSRYSGISKRHMASQDTARLREFLVHVPDHPNALASRLAARKAHIKGATPLIEKGQLPFFGITLSRHPEDGEDPAINGSVLVVRAENEDEVKKLLREDAYTKGGAWDVARATVWPFISS